KHLITGKIKIFNEDFFEIIDTEEKAYWLGFIAADGGITHRSKNHERKRVQLGVAEKDYNHLIKLKESLNLNTLPRKKISKKNGGKFKKREYIFYRYELNSNKMYYDLLDKGIVPQKSLILEPPLNVPEDLVRHWIRGYFDGDGSIGIKRSRNILRFTILGTYNVLKFISDFCSLELEPRKRHNVYIISSSYGKATKFLQLIYKDSNIHLDRKYELWKNN